jgi:peptidoglycan/LPS O-acetylase OafA/YrhL
VVNSHRGGVKLTSQDLNKQGIYAVRGLAAFLVLFLHITSNLVPQSTWVEKSGALSDIFPWVFRGEVGVGVFIFLSGFLLTLKIPQTGHQWGQFYLRRFSRIYPVYLVVLIISISSSRYWDFNGFINAILLFPNLPGTLWPAPWLSTAWSLGVEWTLYLAFPLIILSIRSRARNLLLLVSFLVFMILFGHTFGTDFHTLVYGSILGRAIEFILGIFMALHFQKLKNFKPRDLALLVLVAFATFHAWCTWYLSAGGSVSESYLRVFQPFAESLFAFTLIVIFQGNFVSKVRHLVSPLVFMGVVSYPLYLTHLIVLDGIKRFSTANPSSWIGNSIGLQSVLIIALSLILAWIIHEAIEKPGMRLGRSKRVDL